MIKPNLRAACQQIDQLIESDQWIEALAVFQPLIKQAPLTPGVMERGIQVLRGMEDWQGLMDMLMKARNRYQLWPDGSDLLMGQGMVESEEWSQAIPYLELAIEQESSSGWAHHFLGKALRHTGQLEEALHCQQQASEQLPEFAWAPFEAAQVLLAMDQPKRAVLEMNEARRRTSEPNEVIETEWEKLRPTVMLSQVDEQLAAGNTNEALAILRQALIKLPENEALLQRLSQLVLKGIEPTESEAVDITDLDRSLNTIERLLDQLEKQAQHEHAIKADELSYL